MDLSCKRKYNVRKTSRLNSRFNYYDFGDKNFKYDQLMCN